MSPPPSTPQRFLVRGEGRLKKGQSSKDQGSNAEPTASRAAQFNSTPRFTFPSSTHQQPPVRPPVFAAPLSARRQPPTPRNDDHIAEFDSQESSAPVPIEDLDDVADQHMPLEGESDPLPDVCTPASKRARISLESDVSDLDSIERPRPLKPVSPALRFRNRSPRLGDDGETARSAHPSRPAFILPESREERHKVEFPAIFSPHRKSQRFIPGGLADSMRTHIMEAFSDQYRGANHLSSSGVKLRVSACRNTSQASLIQGHSELGSEEYILLVGHKKRPAVGDMVLVKGVSWEVDIQDKTWAVFLDWRIEG